MAFTPAYLKLPLSEIKSRAQQAVASLGICKVCPRDCAVNRLEDKKAVCKTGRYARVSSYFPHFGEEDCLRGWRGSGTIFFSMCNLRCVFCQNYDISQLEVGVVATPEMLAQMMMELQKKGCHNINFVTPEHVVPQILEALPIAIRLGLHLPLVYNTSAYDSMESLRWMDGIVDIYMPDFKFFTEEHGKVYAKAKDYAEVAKRTIKEMHRQVGELEFDSSGMAIRGLLIRHLVMPGGVADTKEIMNYIVSEISQDTYVNVMAQYYPANKTEKYPEIHRDLFKTEFEQAVTAAREAGLRRLDQRSLRDLPSF
ncbi:radical SAM protein [bacterium]|nr:radical SAM protein [bacterium]MCI0604747.1 radical SAM protein [bacterium]